MLTLPWMLPCRECGGRGSVMGDGIGLYARCNTCNNSTGYYDTSIEVEEAWNKLNSAGAEIKCLPVQSSWEIAIEALEKIAHYDDDDANMDDPGCRDGHICADIAREALGRIRRKGNESQEDR